MNQKVEKIIEVLIEKYNPIQIWLFGSYSNGTFHENSDIDLLIIKNTDTKPSKRPMEVHRLFSPYNSDIDVLVYTPDEFKQQKSKINTIAYFISKEGKLLYEKMD
jgi:uncharacterized protein